MPHKQKWPWATWLDGQPHLLVFGVDFSCSPALMQRKIHSRAWERGCRMRVTTALGGIALRVECIGRDPSLWGPKGSVYGHANS